MDGATAVLEKMRALGITVTPSGDKLLLEPGSKVPAELVQAIRLHKNEILAILTRPKLVEGTPRWHAEQIAQAVRKEGVCIFWSETIGEMVAYIKDDTYRSRVPCGIVVYTFAELRELFGGNRSPKALWLIHEAKRHGGKVDSVGDNSDYQCLFPDMGDDQ